ncbi:MAG: hypothetical protein ACTSRW_03730 [Candidatus Helarchaeota archaeon]
MKKKEKSVLILVNRFPPFSSVLIPRALSFINAFLENNWKVHVLTIRNNPYFAHDYKRMKDIPKEVRVHTVPELPLNRHSILNMLSHKFLFPDRNITWGLLSVIKGLYIFKKYNIDVFLTSVPSYSCLITAFFLKMFTKKFLIADFRDVWSQNLYLTYSNGLYRRLAMMFDRLILKYSDLLSFVTSGCINLVRQKFARISKNKMLIVTNGYEEKMFLNQRLVKFDKFTMVHAGNLYGFHLNNPIPFFKALQEIINENPEMKVKMQVIFAGSMVKPFQDYMKKAGLDEIIEFKGNLPQKEAIDLICSAHVNLLFQYHAKNNAKQVGYSVKCFEYLRTGNHVLAVVPLNSENAELLRLFENVTIVDPKDVKGLKKAILELFDRYSKNELQRGKVPEKIKKYERMGIARKFVNAIECFFNKTT